MRYVVTGATGFIGKALVDYLLQIGHEVYAVSRSKERVVAFWPDNKNIHAISCEIGDYAQLKEQISDAEVFVHLAWAGTTVEDRYSTDLQEKNMLSTLDAMRVAKQMNCRLFVATGSQAEYGPMNDRITEQTPCHPVMAYGVAKVRMLEECSALSEKINMPYLHLRICSVFGKGDHPYTLIEMAMRKMSIGEPIDLSECTQNWNFLYVKDMAYQIERLCEAVIKKNVNPGIYLMASDDTRQLKSYIEEMKRVLKSTSELRYGVLPTKQVTSLNPDTTKLKNAIGELNNYTFEQALLDMQK